MKNTCELLLDSMFLHLVQSFQSSYDQLSAHITRIMLKIKHEII